MADKNKLKAFLSTRVLDDPGKEDEIDENVETKEHDSTSTKSGSLKDFLVIKNEEGEDITLNDAGLDDIIEKDHSNLTDEERVLLYEKALNFKRLGNENHALLCFLGCLKGLLPSSKSHFTMLPQCMSHIADIYANAGDYQKAIEFMQGTKLYYETAIIEAGVQVDTYKKESGEEYRPLDLDPLLDEARRANEYERLSNSCLEQRKFQLALEYCGKAVKLRQKVYGDNNPLTIKSLDLFTLIYAEMGKSQYSEAMNKYSDIAKEINEEKRSLDEKPQQPLDENVETVNATNEQSDIVMTTEEMKTDSSREKLLKEDKTIDNENSNKPESTQEENLQEPPSLNQISPSLIFVFFMISAVLAILLTTTWCYYTDSEICPSQNYFYTQARYWYYFYFKSAATNSSFY